MINKDGSAERLLEDNEIGWHSGDWHINCRSVAISLNSNYENSTPSKIELETIANLIKKHYSQVSKGRVLGHREINIKTTCPSELFLPTESNRGWKEELLNLI
jgi:N-acetyl-anhydromuramyl-L-alanine amidase AmpD